MPSALRKKTARALSKVDMPETYLLNRFLHTAKEKRIEIDGIISFVQEPPLSTLAIDEAVTDHIIYFTNGISKSNVSYYTFTVPKINFRFFEFPIPNNSPEEWERLKPTYHNLNDLLLTSGDDSISFAEDIFPSVKIYLLKTPQLSSSTSDISLWENEISVQHHETDIELPATENYISKFIPKIKKISLLNSNDFLSDTYILDNKKFELNVKVPAPQIQVLNSLQITNDYPMMDYKNLGLVESSTFSLKVDELSVDRKELKDNLLSSKSIPDLKHFLEPVYELSEEVMSEILFSLPEHQQTGAKFLFHSKFALLSDEPELGKEVQAVMALKMLIRIRAARRVLIVTSRFKEFNLQNGGGSVFKSIWEANLSLLSDAFAYKFYDNSADLFTSEEFNNYLIHGVNYDLLEEAFIKGSLPENIQNNFDCILFDDFSSEMLSLDAVKLFMKSESSKYFWILSDLANDTLKEKLEKLSGENQLQILERSKELLGTSEVYFNYSIKVDDEIRSTLKDIFNEGKKKLDDLVQFGNLLRIQPNAFQVINEIQKIGNFNNGNHEGAKTELLKYHVKKILNRNDRILIYSQFEKSGLIEISEILDELNIKHVAFRQMDSQKDIEEKLKLCESHSGKLIYITNIKPNGIKFNFPKVSHLINFDNWWSPATRWQLESKLQKDGKPLSVINYFIDKSAETRLYFELSGLGLTDKNIIDTIQPDKFYQIYDDKYWGNFFELSYDIFTSKSGYDYSIDNMIELVNKSKLFLRGLGYGIITSQASLKNNIYNLTGQISENGKVVSVVAKCIYANHLNSEFIKTMIYTLDEGADKIFIITNGNISHSNLILPYNVSLIDGKQLKKYLELFKIAS